MDVLKHLEQAKEYIENQHYNLAMSEIYRAELHLKGQSHENKPGRESPG